MEKVFDKECSIVIGIKYLSELDLGDRSSSDLLACDDS